MAKINVGEKMENFVFDTPYKRGMDLETVEMCIRDRS